MSTFVSETPVDDELKRRPVSVLCHIPRARIPEYSRFVTEQFVAQPPRSFLNITSNEVEMTLIADVDSMEGLAEFVRRDNELTRRSRARDPGDAASAETVELSEEPWSVLIVDTKEPPKGPVTFGELSLTPISRRT